MDKYNTYEIYKCEDCQATITVAKHNKEILPEGHNWVRRIKREKEEGTVKDPLKAVE